MFPPDPARAFPGVSHEPLSPGQGGAGVTSPVARGGGHAAPPVPTLVVHAVRERAKQFVRQAFPKKKATTFWVKTLDEFERAMRRELIDGVIIDLGNGNDEVWPLAAKAQDYPSAPFFGIAPFRSADAPVIARAIRTGFTDVFSETVDAEAVRALIFPLTFTQRFYAALQEPPSSLRLTSRVQIETWHAILRHGGRPVTTQMLAAEHGVSREHLSRTFVHGGSQRRGSDNGPGANLKRVIDLVRVISAAELCKNPGYDTRDVADVLGFATPSHFAVTTHRIASTRPQSLTGLRTVDLIDRFTQGKTRSRIAGHGGL